MNPIHGEIADVFSGPEALLGKIRAKGALKIVSLELLTDPAPGDRVLAGEGVAIGKVDAAVTKEIIYVPGHPR